MDTISQKAIKACRNNNKVIGGLVALFDKHYNTIERWIEDGDVKLTTRAAVKIISEGTGLTENQIILAEPCKENANVIQVNA